MQVKTYPDDVHYQSKRGKSVTLAKNSKNRMGARDGRGSLSRGKEGDGGTNRATSVFVGKRVVSEETG